MGAVSNPADLGRLLVYELPFGLNHIYKLLTTALRPGEKSPHLLEIEIVYTHFVQSDCCTLDPHRVF